MGGYSGVTIISLCLAIVLSAQEGGIFQSGGKFVALSVAALN